MKRYKMLIIWSALIIMALTVGVMDNSWSLAANGYMSSLVLLAVFLWLIEACYIGWKFYVFGGYLPQRGYSRDIPRDNDRYITSDDRS